VTDHTHRPLDRLAVLVGFKEPTETTNHGSRSWVGRIFLYDRPHNDDLLDLPLELLLEICGHIVLCSDEGVDRGDDSDHDTTRDAPRRKSPKRAKDDCNSVLVAFWRAAEGRGSYKQGQYECDDCIALKN